MSSSLVSKSLRNKFIGLILHILERRKNSSTKATELAGISMSRSTYFSSSVMRTASFGIPHSTCSGNPNDMARIDAPLNRNGQSSRSYAERTRNE